jgi:Protein of unknown function (DUF2637)
MNSYLNRSRRIALYVIAAAVAIASLVSFAESYRGLFLWSRAHQVPGLFAVLWPGMVDLFMLVGELALLVALADQWSWKARILPWAAVAGGLAASIAGNIGHVTGNLWTVRATAAVPPIAAVAILAVGLGILKRIAQTAEQYPGGYEPDPELLTELAVSYSPEQRAELDAAPSDAARVRYAMAVLGSKAAREITDWLEGAGHRVQIDNARTTIARTVKGSANVTELTAGSSRSNRAS